MVILSLPISFEVHFLSEEMSAAKVVWGRFLGQIEAVLPRKLVPFWKAPAGEYFLLILRYFTWRLISAT